jgi:hypothetical protein
MGLLDEKKYVRIRPNVMPEEQDIFGYSKYKEVMNPTAKHIYSIAMIQKNTGVTKYITGLDEESPDVKLLDEYQRKQRIKEIRELAAEIYYRMEYKKLDINDPNFWDKCEVLKPTNEEFWKKISIELDNKGRFLNLSDLDDLILYCVIKGGGIREIAPNIEIAKTNYEKYSFYLDEGDTMKSNVESKRDKAKAYNALSDIVELDDITSERKLRYLNIILIPGFSIPTNMNKSLIKDYYFGMLSDYIDGKTAMHNVSLTRRGVPSYMVFNDVVSKTNKELAIAALLVSLISSNDMYMLDDNKRYFIKDLELTLGDDLWTSVAILNDTSGEERLQRIYKRFGLARGFNYDEFFDNTIKTEFIVSKDSNEETIEDKNENVITESIETPSGKRPVFKKK